MNRSRKAMTRLAICLAAATKLVASSPAQPIIDGAQRLYRAKHYTEAIEAYQQALQLDPAHLGAWRDLGRCYELMGRMEDAFRVWNNLLALDPKDTRTLNAAGETHLARGEYDKAILLLARSLKVDMAQPTIRIRLGEAYQGKGQWEKAANELDQILRSAPGRIDVILRRARLDEEQQRFQEALYRLESALKSHPSAREELSPTLVRQYATLGDQAYMQNEFPKAKELLGKGLLLAPANPHLLASLGWALRREGDLNGAIATWTRALAASDKLDPALLRAIGEVYLEQNNLPLAKQTLEQAHLLLPNEPSPCLQLLEVGLRQGEKQLQDSSILRLLAIPNLPGEWADRAAQHYLNHDKAKEGTDAFSALPSSTPFRGRALARLHAAQSARSYKEGNLDEAIRLNTLALQEDPKNRQALRDLGWGYARKGDWKSCSGVWSKYAQAFPQEAEPHDLLGQAFMFQRDYKKAISSEHKALSLDPNFKSAQLRLLSALVKDDQLSDAKVLGTKLAKERPDDLQVHYRLAEALTRAGDHHGAQEAWQRVRQLDPSKLRPVQNWIRESYAVENYDSALAEARMLTESNPAPESAMVFLALDAELTGDYNKASHWYKRLYTEHPEDSNYWTQSIRLQKLANERDGRILTINEAVRRFPGQVGFQILEAEQLLEDGKAEAALDMFSRLYHENTGNVSAFLGWINSLMATQHYREALNGLQGTSNRSNFLSDFERDLLIADAMSGLKNFHGARQILGNIHKNNKEIVYLPIILYHGIEEQKRTASINLEAFENQMAAIAGAGYSSISLHEMVEMTEGKTPWPDKPIVITFDDARTDSFLKADPILAKYKLKAVMFVPAGDSPEAEDLFHASWQTIRRLQESGRWEMQGHGYDAHDPILLDAMGHSGKFLVDREWLQELNRPETDQEFLARLDEDYRKCKETIEKKAPIQAPIAFAFPYSEAGQISASDVNRAGEYNERIWPRYFQFGMLQNSVGYNAIRRGEAGHRLLWRYEPIRTWSGADLLRQLARVNPPYQAQLKEASVLLWAGFPEQARHRAEDLAQEVPAIMGDTEHLMAEISLAQARPREAALHLQAYQNLQPTGTTYTDDSTLNRRLDWANKSSTGLGYLYSEGSDNRSHNSAYLNAHLPFAAPIDLNLRLGTMQFEEKGLQSLTGRELEGKATWAPTRQFQAALWGGLRQFDAISNRRRGGLDLDFTFDSQGLRVGGSRDDLDSVASIRAGIKAWNENFMYRIRIQQWTVQTDGSYSSTTDQNHINTQRVAALYQPLVMPLWQFGVEYQLADSRYHSQLYYTPMNYQALRALVKYQHSYTDGSSLSLNMAAGRSDDSLFAKRWTGNANLEWVKLWGRQWRSTLCLGGGSTTGYSYRQAGLSVDYHF